MTMLDIEQPNLPPIATPVSPDGLAKVRDEAYRAGYDDGYAAALANARAAEAAANAVVTPA